MSTVEETKLLLASGRVKRRKRVNKAVELGATLGAFAAVAVLALMIGSVVVKALPALNWDLFTRNQATFGEAGGGIQNAIVGSALQPAAAKEPASTPALLAEVRKSFTLGGERIPRRKAL